jgi:hypothetical protein
MKITFKDFITEKLNTNQLIDLYLIFIKILKIHEEHFYHKNLISNNLDFKSKLNKIFYKKFSTDDLYNLIIQFEKDIYNNNLMQSNYGSSLYDICETIEEDPLSSYIQDFSDKDVYIGSESDSDIDGSIRNLDILEKENSEIQELIEHAWDDATEEFGEDEDEILISVIDRLVEYKKLYPHLSKKIQEEIEDLKNYI